MGRSSKATRELQGAMQFAYRALDEYEKGPHDKEANYYLHEAMMAIRAVEEGLRDGWTGINVTKKASSD